MNNCIFYDLVGFPASGLRVAVQASRGYPSRQCDSAPPNKLLHHEKLLSDFTAVVRVDVSFQVTAVLGASDCGTQRRSSFTRLEAGQVHEYRVQLRLLRDASEERKRQFKDGALPSLAVRFRNDVHRTTALAVASTTRPNACDQTH